MKIYTVLIEQNNLKDDYESCIYKLRSLLNSNTLTVSKQSKLRSIIDKNDKFKCDILTLNFDQIMREDSRSTMTYQHIWRIEIAITY